MYNDKLYVTSYEDLQAYISEDVKEESHSFEVLDTHPNGVSVKLESKIIRKKMYVGDSSKLDLNDDDLSDINLVIISLSADEGVTFKISYLYPFISTDFSEIPSYSDEGIHYSQNPKEFLKTLAMFAMILVLFVVSFSLIKKAFHLMKSKK